MKLRSESLLSTDLTVQSLVSPESSFTEAREGSDSFTPFRGRALSDLLSYSGKTSDLPVLEPIKIQSLDSVFSESSESEGEEEINADQTYGSDEDQDSEPEADRRSGERGELCYGATSCKTHLLEQSRRNFRVAERSVKTMYV